MKTEPVGQGVSTASPPSKNKQKNVDQPVAQAGQAPKSGETAQSGVEASKQALNKSILTASLEVSLSAGNNSMSLLYKSAIEHINQALAPELGNNAIQNAASSGMDFSPQATADRIVSMSTAFFSKYAEKHPEKDLTTALNDFAKLIGGGIDKGFSEARQILDGLKVLQGDIASNINKTYQLVQTGLKSFVDNYPRPDAARQAPAPAPEPEKSGG
jgi:hypothetical protein